MDTEWVFALKLNQGGSVNRFKERVAARRFKQIYGQEFMDPCSTVVCYLSTRLVFALADILTGTCSR